MNQRVVGGERACRDCGRVFSARNQMAQRCVPCLVRRLRETFGKNDLTMN